MNIKWLQDAMFFFAESALITTKIVIIPRDEDKFYFERSILEQILYANLTGWWAGKRFEAVTWNRIWKAK